MRGEKSAISDNDAEGSHSRLLLLLRSGGSLFGGFENVVGGEDNGGEIVRLEIEHATTAAASTLHGAHDENAQGVPVERECRSAQRGRVHRDVRNIKQSRPLDDGRNAFDRRGVSSSGSITQTIQGDDLIKD